VKLFQCTLLVMSCLILTACDETYEGQLNLQQQITLKLKKSELVVPMGVHNAKIKASKSEVKLELAVAGKVQKIKFALPKGTKINSFNDVDLMPAVSGQPYQIKGEQKSEYLDTDPTHSSESCSFTTRENRCGYEQVPEVCRDEQRCEGPHGAKVCQPVRVCRGGDTQYICREVTVTHTGSQDVEYYMTYTTTDRHLKIIDPNSQQSIGLFSHRETDSDKHYLSKGACLEGAGRW
jgi:hypothetical protein